jgi:hypothetical protein
MYIYIYEFDRVEWHLPLVCTTPLLLRPQHGIHLPVECCDHVVSRRLVILFSLQCLKPLAPHIGDFGFLCICFVHFGFLCICFVHSPPSLYLSMTWRRFLSKRCGLPRDRFNRSVRHTMELSHLQLLTEVNNLFIDLSFIRGIHDAYSLCQMHQSLGSSRHQSLGSSRRHILNERVICIDGVTAIVNIYEPYAAA